MPFGPAVMGKLLAILMVAPRLAEASTPVAVSVEGGCPSRKELAAALAAKDFTTVPEGRSNEYQVVARPAPNGAALLLRRGTAEILLEREFFSADCRALAEAMAVVIEAYFIEVGVLAKRPPAVAISNPVVTTSASDSPSSLSAVSADPVPLSQGTALDADPSSRVTANLPPAAPTQTPKRPAAIQLTSGTVRPIPAKGGPGAPSVHPRVLLGVGPQLAFPKGTVSPALELGGGLEFPKIPLSTELILNTNLTATTDNLAAPDRVRRWASQGLLRVGAPWDLGTQFRPWVGIGLTMARLRDLALETSASETSFRAVIAAGFEVAWPLGKGWYGRGDLGCSVLTTRDTYLVDKDEIGRGPSVICATMLGVALGRTLGLSAPKR